MCEALYADMLQFLQRKVLLLAEQHGVSLHLFLCRESVLCDELQNEQKRISQEMNDVEEEIQKLEPYHMLCVS